MVQVSFSAPRVSHLPGLRGHARPQELSLLATVKSAGVGHCGGQHFLSPATAMAHITALGHFPPDTGTRPSWEAGPRWGRMFSRLEWLPSEPVFPKRTQFWRTRCQRHSFLADSGQSSQGSHITSLFCNKSNPLKFKNQGPGIKVAIQWDITCFVRECGEKGQEK